MNLGKRNFYCGVDPGYKGAFCLMNAAGTTCKIYAMPVTGEGRDKEIDLHGLETIFRILGRMPGVGLGLEWPNTWPGEPPEAAAALRQGMAYVEAFAFLGGLPCERIAPNLWTGRLGLPGKTVSGWVDCRVGMVKAFYPEALPLIYGPREGLLDGPLDAILICHFLRTQGGEGLKSIRDKFGKDSPEMQAFILSGCSMSGRRRRRGVLPSI